MGALLSASAREPGSRSQASPKTLAQQVKRILYTPGDNKTKWGRKYWKFLHLRAIRWRGGFPSAAKLEREFLRELFGNLPCEVCQGHALNYLSTNPLDFSSRENYHLWMFNFHNAVNERLGKPELCYSLYRRLYYKELKEQNLL